MKKNLYQTASLVTALSIAERALGFLYRIVLSRLIGAEGVGLYQVALSVFSVFVTVGSGGLPVTVSRLISKSKAEENGRSEHAVVSAGLVCALLLTLPVCLLFSFCPNAFSFLFSDKRSLRVFGVLLVGLSLTCLYAVVRGGFWGNKKFLLTSILEIVEEGVMVVVGVLLLQGATDPFEGAKKAAVAVVVSYFVSCASSLICYFLHKGKFASPKGKLRPLLASATPITAVRAGGSLIGSAVAVLFPAMLMRAGASGVEALELFGVVSGMALPVLSVPSTVIGSISLVLVPELSEDYYKKNAKRLTCNVERGIYVSAVIACAIIPFFFVFGEDLGRLLYSDALAGEMIKNCCVMLLPMSLTMISTGILNSINHEKQTLVYYFIGAAAMLGCILLLPNAIGAYAYPVGLGVSFVLSAILNLAFLCKKIPLSKRLVKNCAVAAALVLPVSLFGKFLYAPLTLLLSSPLAILCAAVGTAAFSTIVYLLCGVFPSFSFKKLFSKK